VHTGLLQAKSAFAAKENTFGVGFELRRPPAKQQCPRRQRQLAEVYIASGELYDRKIYI